MRSERAACDAGPIIHLHEIGRTDCFSLFGRLFVPEPVLGEILDEVVSECIRGRKPFEIVPSRGADKVAIEYTAYRYSLSVADSSVMQCARAKGARTVLTDDLGLREAARNRMLQPVGSIGILLRACVERMASKPETLASLDDLMVKSSLFITPALVNNAKDAVRAFRF